MALMKKLREWADEALSDDERDELAAIAGQPKGALAVLNAVALEGQHIEGALREVAALAAHQNNGLWQGLAIHAYAEAAGLERADVAAGALHARVVALNKWTAANDPGHQSDVTAVLAAAARCPLIQSDDGVGFHTARFTDLVEFWGELPW